MTEYIDIPDWSCADMTGLNTNIVVHGLPINHVKQTLRYMKPKWYVKIKEKVIEELEAGFLDLTDYLERLANIISMHKNMER